MGLLDVLTGVRNGPRGVGGGGRGMSPITRARLGLLATRRSRAFLAETSAPPRPTIRKPMCTAGKPPRPAGGLDDVAARPIVSGLHHQYCRM
jgi:hypothetical protein